MSRFLAGRKLRAEELNALPQPLDGNILAQSGTYLTTSSTTELALPKLSLTGVTAGTNGALRFEMNLRLSTGTAGETFEFSIRQTTALTGTLRAQIRHIVRSGNQYAETIAFPWVPANGSVVGDSFHLSITRISGAGTLAVEADNRSSFAVYSVLDTSVWSNVP